MLSFLRQEHGFYRRVVLLALPVMLQNLITTSLGFIDTFMVGLLGTTEMSAVTAANVPIFVMQLLVFGLQSGSSVLISQYWGKGDCRSINRVLGIGFFVAGGVSIIFALALGLFPSRVMWLITDNVQLIELGTPYIRIVGFSYILNSISSIYIGMQRSIENPRFGMVVFGTSMCFNTVGNYLLIFGKFGFPMLGITGAAIATFASRVVEFIICFGYALRCRTMPLDWSAIMHPSREMLRAFVKFSAPVVLNESLWSLGTSMYTVIMGHMAISAEMIAAYTIAGNIDRMMLASSFGIAAAAAVIVGKEIGMGNTANVLSIGKALSAVSFLAGLGASALYALLYPTLLKPIVIPLFRLSAMEAELCTVFILCYAIAAPMVFLLTTIVVGVLRGGGDVRTALAIDVGPLWFIVIPAFAIAALIFEIPAWMCCTVVILDAALKTPLCIFRLRSGKWINDVTV